MTHLGFPQNPTKNQQYSTGGATWEWNGAAWDKYSVPSGPTLTESETEPESPKGGDSWKNTETNKSYIYLECESAWIEL
tara:strand:+ start:1140 stop:1376 length:237 start_codon:yes stop_codon:yes gene_type:complete